MAAVKAVEEPKNSCREIWRKTCRHNSRNMDVAAQVRIRWKQMICG